ncbi:S-adenosylmethionine:tRNA ribosyltransferase-isomerase [Flavisolibacter tropicus]|nr:S-adenosylmethionine:tRNA ribosyltransferase-isomerase [Flavisolibacter tropicus]
MNISKSLTKAAVCRMITNPSTVYISEYDYELPANQIAEFPLAQRDSSRLLVYEQGQIKDDCFTSLPSYLPNASTLVLNNTRVIEARLFFKKDTGAIIEIFCLGPHTPASMEQALSSHHETLWYCLIGGASKWKHGQILHKEVTINGVSVILNARFVGKSGDQFIIAFTWDTNHSFSEVLHVAGSIPLPPYIKRKAENEDSERYQTVFAKHEGSVAAPTAALHFTESVFDELKAKDIFPHYITLHVGAGTFKPVKTETIEGHNMHAEKFSVSATLLKKLISAKTIVAVGTTSLRTLESLHWFGIKVKQGQFDFTLHQWEAYELPDASISYNESLQILLDYLRENKLEELHCETSLLIMPGYEFKSAKALVTNFHQPKSTLLLLVAAFIGIEWKKLYEHALQNNYRFLSYGDSSLLWRETPPSNSPEGEGSHGTRPA